MIFSKINNYIVFISISSVLFSLLLLIEINNGKFNPEDFKVFYMAAKAMLSGNQVYGIPFGLSSGFYKYSPFMLFVFSGFTLFSFKIAAIVHLLSSAVAALFSIIILEQLVNKYLFTNNRRRVISSFLILLSVLLHIVRDLHMGNTNTIIIFLITIIIKLILESKEVAAGIILALIILLKPYFIVLSIILLFFNKRKTVVSMTITGVVLTLSTAFVLGFEKSYNMHLQWFNEMIRQSDYLYSTHTITYLLNYYLGISIPQKFSVIIIGILALLISFIFWYKSKNTEVKEKNKSLIIGFFIIASLIPNVLITDFEHFVFSLPIITVLILYLKNKKNYLLISLFIVFIFMFGGNSQDLVGKELTIKLILWGWVGIANIVFITALITAFFIDKTSWRLKG